jgi:GTP diphosphokinase / guanosine-3',5'-bis(diphosphate) 3'-diphosphatase
MEIQIRTEDMHRVAEAGVASHWLYKSSDTSLNDLQQKTHQLLQSLLEIQTQSRDSAEFLENVKIDLFPDEIYVFTPNGDIKALPKGATAVDFAYAVHTDIGDRCVATKINGQLAPLRTELRNGDRVEIITATHAAPNPAWLNFVVSGKARSHIRHYLKTMRFEESVQLGGRLLDQALRALKTNPEKINATHWEQMLRTDKGKSKEDVLADIGLGRRLNVVVARRLLQLSDAAPEEAKKLGTITIRGSDGIAVHFAQCCTPIPGDPIIGLINKEQGLTIHTHDCRAIRDHHGDPDKWVEVQWEAAKEKVFDVRLRLLAANKPGVLARIASAMADADANIEDFSTDEKESSAYRALSFTIQVHNRTHLALVLQKVRALPDVVRITRTKAGER